LNEQNRENLTKLANTLNEYSNTEILVAGHTDNVGDDRYNEKLSDNRVDAVADFYI
jgi:outer membrane protein OmpA-like peptidoglycan-associated protein